MRAQQSMHHFVVHIEKSQVNSPTRCWESFGSRAWGRQVKRGRNPDGRRTWRETNQGRGRRPIEPRPTQFPRMMVFGFTHAIPFAIPFVRLPFSSSFRSLFPLLGPHSFLASHLVPGAWSQNGPCIVWYAIFSGPLAWLGESFGPASSFQLTAQGGHTV